MGALQNKLTPIEPAAAALEYRFLDVLADRIADQAFKKFAAKLETLNEPMAFSIEQAAEKLSVSRSTLKTMIKDREIAVVRRGTRVLITRQAILNYLERNEA